MQAEGLRLLNDDLAIEDSPFFIPCSATEDLLWKSV